MIKQVYMAECDLCGKTEPAKIGEGSYGNTIYEMPEGWGYAHNRQFMLCTECVLLRGGDSVVESNSEK